MKTLTTLTDEELIGLYIAGDTNAFNNLIIRHKNKIYTSIRMLVKVQDIADDIFQQVFVKIIETITAGRYNEEGKFLSWAMRIAYNMCMDHFRFKKRIPVSTDCDEYGIFEKVNLSEGGIENKIVNSEINAELNKLLNRLPEDQREVVILRHYADLSFKEIAALTNCSINTALGRMRYALTSLRKLKGEYQLV
jgi:RNA polymerase sigma factor (sigma-70 family)